MTEPIEPLEDYFTLDLRKKLLLRDRSMIYLFNIERMRWSHLLRGAFSLERVARVCLVAQSFELDGGSLPGEMFERRLRKFSRCPSAHCSAHFIQNQALNPIQVWVFNARITRSDVFTLKESDQKPFIRVFYQECCGLGVNQDDDHDIWWLPVLPRKDKSANQTQ